MAESARELELLAKLQRNGGLNEYDGNEYRALRNGRVQAEGEANTSRLLDEQQGTVDRTYAGAQQFLNQLPVYQAVNYQGPTEADIQGEYQSQLGNVEAATNPYVYGTSGNLAANEIARQQGNAAGRGLLGASGSINQGAALTQQANVQQAAVRNSLSSERFTRRQGLGNTLTGLAQYNQANRYQSELQKALQGLSTYGDYYAKPTLGIQGQRIGLSEKRLDYSNQKNTQEDLALRQEQQANREKGDGGLFGGILNFGTKLIGGGLTGGIGGILQGN
jgi:hypothetical protein